MKKYKVLTIVIILCFSLLLSGCKYNTSQVNIKDIFVVKAQADYTEAYYLADNGNLYSPGADGDAGRYVCYINERKGLVAENVRSFSSIRDGGYYITRDNNLYVWNWESLRYIGYRKNKPQLVIKGVSQAIVRLEFTVYTDLENRLWLIGKFNNNSYSFKNPKLISENVFSVYCFGNEIIYATSDGSVKTFGSDKEEPQYLKIVKEQEFENVSGNFQMIFSKDAGMVLENGNLHFYGDFDKFLGKEEINEVKDRVIARNIKTFDFCVETAAAVNRDGEAYLWGKVLSNGPENTETFEYTYLNGKKMFDNINNVCVRGPSAICFVTKDGKTEYYGSTGSVCPAGNSNRGRFIGINNKPIVWQ